MDAHDPLRLDNQLCFPLYACAREVMKRYKDLSEVQRTIAKRAGDRVVLS